MKHVKSGFNDLRYDLAPWEKALCMLAGVLVAAAVFFTIRAFYSDGFFWWNFALSFFTGLIVYYVFEVYISDIKWKKVKKQREERLNRLREIVKLKTPKRPAAEHKTQGYKLSGITGGPYKANGGNTKSGNNAANGNNVKGGGVAANKSLMNTGVITDVSGRPASVREIPRDNSGGQVKVQNKFK